MIFLFLIRHFCFGACKVIVSIPPFLVFMVVPSLFSFLIHSYPGIGMEGWIHIIFFVHIYKHSYILRDGKGSFFFCNKTFGIHFCGTFFVYLVISDIRGFLVLLARYLPYFLLWFFILFSLVFSCGLSLWFFLVVFSLRLSVIDLSLLIHRFLEIQSS